MRLIDADAIQYPMLIGSSRDEEFMRKAIDEQPTIESGPAQHWIPCSERLPENDAKCLVYTSDKRICMAKWNEKYDGQGAWYIISDYAPKLYRIKNVPFWMPLPEPPDGGADDAAD